MGGRFLPILLVLAGCPEPGGGRDFGDDGDSGPCVETLFYLDDDRDGFGDQRASVGACTAPEGYVEDATDCDDEDAAVSPDSDETCNAADDDCDDEIDEAEECAVDTDDDGVPDWVEVEQGTDPASADRDGDGVDDGDEAELGTDPLDSDSDTSPYPGAGSADSATDCMTDADGYDSDGYSGTDSDDSDSAVNPAAAEICDCGLDDDCDAAIDCDDADCAGDGACWTFTGGTMPGLR